MRENFYQIELNRTSWEVPERYKNLVQIGCGAYGQVSFDSDGMSETSCPSNKNHFSGVQVCSAEDKSTRQRDGTFAKVAIKKLARPFQSAIHAKRTYRELRMLKHMDHENIIGLLDVFTPSKTLDSFTDVYLVTPLMGADLNQIVKTQRLSDDHVQFLVYQILRGMKYVHSAGIIHRVRRENEAVNEKDIILS